MTPLARTGLHRVLAVAGGLLTLLIGSGAAIVAASGALRAELGKASAPIPAATLALIESKGSTGAAPLVLRSFKKEAEIEVWKQNHDGRFVFIKSYPICRWSGQLGPKHYAGDRQTPEGFYAVGPSQMNPNSHYYLSFDTGFPNAYDKAHGATGSAVMVHGTCSSMGCFAMTDKVVGEIYSIARDALKGGQPAFQLQAFPFHMTARNMALYRNDPNIDFWRQLKEGSDRFEAAGQWLRVGVKDGRYTFAPSGDAATEATVQSFHATESTKIAAIVAAGSAAVRTTYADGGQNAIFAALLRKGANLGVVSRPEALAYAGIDVTLVPARAPPRHVVAALPALTIDKDEWRPDAAIPVVKAHADEALAPVDGAALVAAPMHYPLWHAPVVARLIDGAMPMRKATWTN